MALGAHFHTCTTHHITQVIIALTRGTNSSSTFHLMTQKLIKELAIQELVLDFINMKGQELYAKIPEHGNIESEVQTANDSWSTVQRLVSEKAEILYSMSNELTQFEANVSKLGDLLNYTEVCLDETETSKEAGLNGLHKQLAKLKVLVRLHSCLFYK